MNAPKGFELHTIRDHENSLDIRVGIKSPKSGKAQRWLAFCNGRTEWIEKYSHLPDEFNLDDHTGFLTWDHRGQGASGGARAWINDYKTYGQDAKQVIDKFIGSQPYHLLCHSMGCLIAIHATLNGYIKPKAIVISSPLLGLPRHPMDPALAHKISTAITALGLGHLGTRTGRHWRPPFERNVLTHSHERYYQIQNSPYPVPSPTFEWVKASYAATQEILQPELLKNLPCPVLILCGTDEKVVDIEAITPWIETARRHTKQRVELQWIQGGRHELFYESKEFFDKAKNAAEQWLQTID
jgi:alpha-beta hydrolase superfamily lysophospholipase